MESVSLSGKTAIVTGANIGIGLQTAKELARRGARVILACRSEERGLEAKATIMREVGDSAQVEFRQIDLGSLESVRKFAQEFNANEGRLDLLVNNAACVSKQRQTTTDGFELAFGVNHLGHFLLTNLLLDKLKSSAPSRVVTVSSAAHETNQLDMSDLNIERNWTGFKSYGRSKTANVLFGVHLAKVLEGSGVTSYVLHPGVIPQTGLARDYPFMQTKCWMCCISCLMPVITCCRERALSLEDGAATTLYCCLDPSIAQHSGKYYSYEKEVNAKPHATNPETAKQLWDESLKMVGLS